MSAARSQSWALGEARLPSLVEVLAPMMPFSAAEAAQLRYAQAASVFDLLVVRLNSETRRSVSTNTAVRCPSLEIFAAKTQPPTASQLASMRMPWLERKLEGSCATEV